MGVGAGFPGPLQGRLDQDRDAALGARTAPLPYRLISSGTESLKKTGAIALSDPKGDIVAKGLFNPIAVLVFPTTPPASSPHRPVSQSCPLS